METKTAIAAEWFKAYPKPVIDSAGKYGAGLALGKKPGEIAISVPFDWAMFACAPPAAGCCQKNARARWRRRSTGFRAIPRLGMPP